MPTKKIAKKSAKKAAKKPAYDHLSQDLRRAYEYLGRVDILEGALSGSPFREVSTLATLAQEELTAGQYRDAAELLRAAEHICFAALAPEDSAGTSASVSAELEEAMAAELDHLTELAEEHWTESKAEGVAPHAFVAAIYITTLKQARRAFAAGNYRPALELARAAEALAELTDRRSCRLSQSIESRHSIAS